MANPNVVSVNVGSVRQLEWQGHQVVTAIWKYPVEGRILLAGVNLEGDDQADRSVHGGSDKAVYAYAREDYAYWKNEEGIDAEDALFGENLTTEGIDLSSAIVGERWAVGSTILEVAQPRLPCYKLGIRVGDPHFVKRFQRALRMGAYLRIIQEGDVGAGDSITVTHTPAHGITLRNMTEALHDETKAMALRSLPYLPEFWRNIANRE